MYVMIQINVFCSRKKVTLMIFLMYSFPLNLQYISVLVISSCVLLLIIIITTYAWLLCRFDLEELQQACVGPLQQSTCQTVDSFNKFNQNLYEIGDSMDEANNNDEEIVSDDELEELHEFLLTQRQRKADTHALQSVPAQEHLASAEEPGRESESEEGDVMDLSQALLRKLEESFADVFTENENQILSDVAEEDRAICDKLQDSSSSADTHESDHLMLAAQDSNGTEVNDVKRLSATKLSASEHHEADELELLHSEQEESLVKEHVEADTMENQQMTESAQRDAEICDMLKDSQISISASEHYQANEPALRGEPEEILVTEDNEADTMENQQVMEVGSSIQQDAEICDTLKATSQRDQADELALCCELKSLVTEHVQADTMENQQVTDSVQQHTEICDMLKDSPISVSTGNSDHLTSVVPNGGNVEVNDINDFVTNLPTSSDACEDQTCSVGVVNNELASPCPSAGTQYCSAASPRSLFEESSLEQCYLEQLNSSNDISAPADDNDQLLCYLEQLNSDNDISASPDDNDQIFCYLEHMNCNSDISAAADNNRQILNTDFSRCESPTDLFDSPSSRHSEISPPASLQAQTEILCEQGNETPPSSPKSTSLIIGSPPQTEIDTAFKQGDQSSRKLTFSPIENLRMQSDVLTCQGEKFPAAAPEVELRDMIELEEELADELESFHAIQLEALISQGEQSPTMAPEVELAVEKELADELESSDVTQLQVLTHQGEQFPTAALEVELACVTEVTEEELVDGLDSSDAAQLEVLTSKGKQSLAAALEVEMSDVTEVEKELADELESSDVTQLEVLTSQGKQFPAAALEVELADVTEVAKEELVNGLESSDATQLEVLTSKAEQSPTAAPELELADVTEVVEKELVDELETSDTVTDVSSSTGSNENGILKCLHLRKVRAKSRNPLSADVDNLPRYTPPTQRSHARQCQCCRNNSPKAAPEINLTDVDKVVGQMHVQSSDAVTAFSSSAGSRPSASRKNGIVFKRLCLRKMRTKSRNSLCADVKYLPHYSSAPTSSVRHSSRCRNTRKSRPVYSDVEPDSDDDDDDDDDVGSGTHVSCRLSLFSGSASAPSTKDCYVKLTRINIANLLPQVEMIRFFIYYS